MAAPAGPQEASPASSAKPSVWKPRWRTEGASARPTVPFYTSREICLALDCEPSHTFVIPRRKPGEAEDAAPKPLVAIFNHLKANPNAPAELWTRHSFDLIERNIGVPVPLFSETPAVSNQYELAGWYAIESFEVMKGGSPEVKAFIEKREESKGRKSAAAWASALSEDWARVELKKAEDRGDPIKDRIATKPPARTQHPDPPTTS